MIIKVFELVKKIYFEVNKTNLKSDENLCHFKITSFVYIFYHQVFMQWKFLFLTLILNPALQTFHAHISSETCELLKKYKNILQKTSIDKVMKIK